MSLLLALIATAPAADIYWNKASPLTLQATVDAAMDGDTIHVEPGVYKAVKSLVIDHPVRVVSEGGPDGTHLYANVEIRADGVELRGMSLLPDSGRGVWVEDAYGVLLADLRLQDLGDGVEYGGGVRLTRSSATLFGVTITLCDAMFAGGGISVEDSDLVVQYGSITSNDAGFGGGIFVDDLSGLTLVDTHVGGNTADGDGGGIYLDKTTDPVLLDGVDLSNNFSGDFFNVGAGLYTIASTVELRRAVLYMNFPDDGGSAPAVFVGAGTVTSTGSVVVDHLSEAGSAPVRVDAGAAWLGFGDQFLNNTGSSFGAGAGAIEGDGTIELYGSFFVGNAGVDGGAVSSGGSLLVRSSTFQDNEATGNGGAIQATGDLDVARSTFLSNLANRGGAIWTDGDGRVFPLRDSTFISNAADYEGGAVRVLDLDLQAERNRFVCNSGGEGGAIATRLASGTLLDNTFTSNIVWAEGGAIEWDAGTNPTILRNGFLWNTASSEDSSAASFIGVGPTFQDNLVVGNTSYGIDGVPVAFGVLPPAIILSNRWWDNAAGAIYTEGGIWKDGMPDLTEPKLPAVLVACPTNVFEDGDGPVLVDVDNDGYSWDSDCDDSDPAVYPSAPELCDDGVDSNCDGSVLDADAPPGWYADFDEDGAGDAAVIAYACVRPDRHVEIPGDCDPIDAAIGLPGDWHPDADLDGYGDPSTSVSACEAPPGWVADASDCDDTRADVYPGAQEMCDGSVDEDCDGELDEQGLWYPDADDDNYGVDVGIFGVGPCTYDPPRLAPVAGDCHDFAANINPGMPEICHNDIDDDCTGLEDDNAGPTWYTDGDGDGFGDPDTAIRACDQPDDRIGTGGDCDDVHEEVNPDAIEICNDEDDDCNAVIDDVPDPLVGYADADGDGYGDADVPLTGCDAVEDATDCDDADYAIHPGAPEVSGNAFDEDCSDDVPFWTGGGGGCATTGGGAGWLGILAAALFRRGNPPVTRGSRGRHVRHD